MGSNRKAWRAGGIALIGCAALLAGCEKHDNSPAADNARQSAEDAKQAAKDAGQQIQQKLDQAASFVNRQVDAARADVANHASGASGASAPMSASAAEFASSAKGQLRDAASSTNAALGRAAVQAGVGLEAAGRKLQQWASSTAASSSASASDASGSH